MLANLARTHGTKSYLFVPENEAHLLEKMHRIWGNQPGFDPLLRGAVLGAERRPDEP
jgi:hypothetical protein